MLCRRELREAVDHIIIDMLTSAHIHRHIERKLVSKHLAAAVEKQNKMLSVSAINKHKYKSRMKHALAHQYRTD